MILDLFAQTLDVYVYRAGVANVFIAPDLIQKLFSGKNVVGRSCQKIEKLQLLWRHIDIFSHIHNGIIGFIDCQIGIFDTFHSRLCRNGSSWLVAAQHCLDARDKLLGVEGLFHVIIRTKLQTEHLVKNFAFGGQHDDGNRGTAAHFTADLIAVDAGKHQIQQNQVRREGIHSAEGGFPVLHDHRIKAFLGQVQRNEFGDIGIVINNQNFLFIYHNAPRYLFLQRRQMIAVLRIIF